MSGPPRDLLWKRSCDEKLKHINIFFFSNVLEVWTVSSLSSGGIDVAAHNHYHGLHSMGSCNTCCSSASQGYLPHTYQIHNSITKYASKRYHSGIAEKYKENSKNGSHEYFVHQRGSDEISRIGEYRNVSGNDGELYGIRSKLECFQCVFNAANVGKQMRFKKCLENVVQFDQRVDCGNCCVGGVELEKETDPTKHFENNEIQVENAIQVDKSTDSNTEPDKIGVNKVSLKKDTSNVTITSSDGLVLRVINEKNGLTILHRPFQTWNIFSHGMDLMFWLERLQTGRIAVLTVRKSGLIGLFFVRNALSRMGSVFVDTAPVHDMWTWVWVVGGKTLLESLQSYNSVLFSHTLAHYVEKVITIKPTSESDSDLQRYNTHVNVHVNQYKQRKNQSFIPNIRHHKSHHNRHNIQESLCETLGALGSYCQKNYYNELKQPTESKKNITESKIGIVVCAGVRIQYLIATLQSLFNAILVHKTNVLVTLGSSFESNTLHDNIIALLVDLSLEYRVVESFQDSKNRTPDKFVQSFHFYRQSWLIASEYFHDMDYIAFLDEDVIVSKDWLWVLSHAAPVLEEDSSLWCVTGTNGVLQTGGDPSKLLRGVKQPGWGFLVTKSTVVEAVLKMEVGAAALYDVWLMQGFAKGRECVFPEVARTKHFGVGVSTLPDIHQRFSLEVKMYDGPQIEMTPISKLVCKNYSNNLIYELQHSKLHSNNPRKSGFFEIASTEHSQVYVFPYVLRRSTNFFEWTVLADCIGLYPHSTQGMHEYTVRISLERGNALWLIGVPISKFTPYLPKHYLVWNPGISKENDLTFSYKLPHFGNQTLDGIMRECFKPRPA